VSGSRPNPSVDTEGLRELGLAAAGRRQEQDAAGTVASPRFALASHGPETERLEVVQAAELLERLGAAVDRHEAALLQLPSFDLPQRFSLGVLRFT
jgi:hypothetical protein